MTPATASVPSGPTNLTVTPGSAGATLNWTASTSGSPTSYSIFRGTATDGEAVTPVGTVSGTTTTFTDTGLTNGKTYFYNVAANNSVGVSPDTNEVSVSPGSATTVPPAPTGLSANPVNSEIDLTWNPSEGATSYSIYRGTAPGAEGATPVGTTTTDSFNDTGLTNGTGYYYTVAASNAAGTSAKTAETNTVPTAAVVAPPVPFGVVVTPSASQVNLQWTYEEGATSYQVYRSTTPGGEGATPLATVTSSSYTDTAVTSGTTYYYEIVALTGTTASARSSEYSANTSGTGTAPPTPAGLVATAGNASVALAWTASAGATSYSHLPRHRARGGRRHAGRHVRVEQLHRHRADQRHHVLLHDHREQQRGHVGAFVRSARHAGRIGRDGHPAVPGQAGHRVVGAEHRLSGLERRRREPQRPAGRARSVIPRGWRSTSEPRTPSAR